MNSDDQPAPLQPLTFGGVAAFARAPWLRLFAVQLAFAVLAAACVMICLRLAWFPVVTGAVRALPDKGALRQGRLEWPDNSPAVLAENRFLSLVVDVEDPGRAGQTAHLQIEFGRRELRFNALAGYLPLAYPANWSAAFNRPALQPWWGAWRLALLAGLGALVVVKLFFSWALLAALYLPVVRGVSCLTNRKARWGECWRLAAAALLPGALVMSGAILLYGLSQLPLEGLALALALHLVIGWVYLLGAALRLPPPAAPPAAARANPFAPDPPAPRPGNPFHPPPTDGGGQGDRV